MKFFYAILFVVAIFLVSGCQTIENKSQSAIKKENEKLSKFIGQPESELKIVMGNPNNEIIKKTTPATKTAPSASAGVYFIPKQTP